MLAAGTLVQNREEYLDKMADLAGSLFPYARARICSSSLLACLHTRLSLVLSSSGRGPPWAAASFPTLSTLYCKQQSPWLSSFVHVNFLLPTSASWVFLERRTAKGYKVVPQGDEFGGLLDGDED